MHILICGGYASLRIMRLGWFARLLIVGVVFWTVGGGTYRFNDDQKAAAGLRQTYYSTCLEDEVLRRQPSYDRKPNEDCSAYSQRQFYWLSNWNAYTSRLMRNLVEAIAFALLATLFYWSGRWILAGRKPSGDAVDNSQ